MLTAPCASIDGRFLLGWKRRHGFQRPLNLKQIITWIWTAVLFSHLKPVLNSCSRTPSSNYAVDANVWSKKTANTAACAIDASPNLTTTAFG
ncbi:MAG: hypothetical protein EZS28_013405 [Streblomastix strix]|uniref:Uncharacterized protein n=1 Tax=Streblomastix strix TaxID=222440 RepID=A0A5J4W820_9EUKA|nr:MAG: hypothetical protein EZS28_013405 [Streblomastix strix]